MVLDESRYAAGPRGLLPWREGGDRTFHSIARKNEEPIIVEVESKNIALDECGEGFFKVGNRSRLTAVFEVFSHCSQGGCGRSTDVYFFVFQ